MKNEQIKPKRTCQQCKYWGSVSGTHHSMCSFRWEASKHFPPQGPERGIKEGWWLFPFNYDPVWMIGECMEFNDGQDKENLSSVEYQLYQARQTGKTEAMIQSMVHQLKNNENVGVAGCKDPARILKRLTELGVSAEATVMSYYRLESDEQVYTGYLFKQKDIPERGLSHVYKFPNEMVVVYDNNGDQVPELQGVYSIKMYEKILSYSDENTFWQGF